MMSQRAIHYTFITIEVLQTTLNCSQMLLQTNQNEKNRPYIYFIFIIDLKKEQARNNGSN